MPDETIYTSDPSIEVNIHTSSISSEVAVTIPGLFRERVRRSPEAIAYRYFDDKESLWKGSTWKEMGVEVARWQAALQKESLDKGDRVAIMAENCREWVICDQAALGLGLVLVPLYTQDRADNATYILKDCDAKLLVIGNQEQWSNLSQNPHALDTVDRVVSIEAFDVANETKFISLQNWLNEDENGLISEESDNDELATIVYTSGTTGNPKGVMLSHRNIISNAYSSLRSVYVTEEDMFLSFLPLSHTLERTTGYYLPMMAGATVAFARSIPDLAEDLLTIKPSCMVSVPRIYERIYAKVKEGLAKKSGFAKWLFNVSVDVGWKRFQYKQGKTGYSFSILLWPLLDLLVAKKMKQAFGGNLKGAICGGAPMPPGISRTFNALGVTIIQGYGLTETSPVITVNRIMHNVPESVGLVCPELEVRIGDNDELLARGDNVMMGYWNCPEETSKTIVDGWLHSGDKARIENGYVYLTGRLKEIIVMANGEKVSPADMEMAIAQDALFEQVIIIGEARPYLTVITVLEKELWKSYAKKKGFAENDFNKSEVEEVLLGRISRNLHKFPGYAQIRRIRCVLEPWTIEQGLLTPTLKVKRPRVTEKFQQQIDSMYEGHTV